MSTLEHDMPTDRLASGAPATGKKDLTMTTEKNTPAEPSSAADAERTSRGIGTSREQDARVTIEAGSARVEFDQEPDLVPAPLVSITRIGPFSAARLATANIRTAEDLLKLCADPAGRTVVSDMTGLHPDRLLEWAGFVDLMRIDGLVETFAELLLACGIRSVGDLTGKSAAGLADAMMEFNAGERLTGLVPSEAVLEGWIRQAGRLDPRVQV
jgi:hypothetical protein